MTKKKHRQLRTFGLDNEIMYLVHLSEESSDAAKKEMKAAEIEKEISLAIFLFCRHKILRSTHLDVLEQPSCSDNDKRNCLNSFQRTCLFSTVSVSVGFLHWEFSKL